MKTCEAEFSPNLGSEYRCIRPYGHINNHRDQFNNTWSNREGPAITPRRRFWEGLAAYVIGGILGLILALVIVAALAHVAYAAGWAFVWGWSPSKCSNLLGGTAQWVWDSVTKQPNWLCKYPIR